MRPNKTPNPTLTRLLASLLASAAFLASAQDRQTPIDINGANIRLDQAVPALHFSYTTTDLSVVNTFNPPASLPKDLTTIKANVPANAGVLTVGAKVWDLLQFHFHTPSEHAFGLRRAPMEVHFVHKDRAKNVGDPDSLLVVGAWIIRGAKNLELEKIFAHLPGLGGTVGVPGFNLSKVLPADQSRFAYSGSLTAPLAVPGSTVQQQLDADIFPEIVRWIMLTAVVEMSEEQIEKFRAFYPEEEGNSRKLQPLAGRRVNTDLNAGEFASYLNFFNANTEEGLVAIKGPADRTVECGAGTAPEKTGKATATASQSCGSVTITYHDTSVNGPPPIVKIITRTFTATDACHNHASVQQTITVVDTKGPAIQRLTATPAKLAPMNNQFVAVKLDDVVVDSCSTAQQVTSTVSVKVTDPAGADGKSYFTVKGHHEVSLRAKPGVTYTITLTCADFFGNKASKSVVVPVK